MDSVYEAYRHPSTDTHSSTTWQEILTATPADRMYVIMLAITMYDQGCGLGLTAYLLMLV